LRSPALLLECVRLCLVEVWGLSSEEWQARGPINEAGAGSDGRETGSEKCVIARGVAIESRVEFLLGIG